MNKTKVGLHCNPEIDVKQNPTKESSPPQTFSRQRIFLGEYSKAGKTQMNPRFIFGLMCVKLKIESSIVASISDHLYKYVLLNCFILLIIMAIVKPMKLLYYDAHQRYAVPIGVVFWSVYKYACDF